MANTIRVGYIYALRDLEKFIRNHGPKNPKARQHLYACLDDMQYCIDQTKRCEQYDEREKLAEELKNTRPK